MNTKALAVVIFSSLTCSLYSQDYVQTDTSRITNVDIFDRGLRANCEILMYQQEGEMITRSPEEVTGFFIAPSHEYRSTSIELADTSFPAFIRKIEGDGPNLYEYSGAMGSFVFIEKKDGKALVRLSKDDYVGKLQEYYNNDPRVSELLGRTSFGRNVIPKYVEKLEKGDFSRLPFPYLAVEAGLVNTKFTSAGAPDVRLSDIPAGNGFQFGLTVVAPIYYSAMSVTTGLYFSQYNLQGTGAASALQYKLKAWQFQIPVMLRYSLTEGNIRPYAAMGPRLTKLITPEHQAYLRDAEGVITAQDLDAEDLFSPTLAHWGIALGSEFELASEKMLYLELRYFYHVGREAGALVRNDFAVVAGFSL